MDVDDDLGDPGRSIAEAEDVQRRLAAAVEIPERWIDDIGTVAGMDVSYERGSNRLAAGVVVVELSSGKVVDEVVVPGLATFPYEPGLLAFREAPVLLEALDQLATVPDVLMCDGQGIAHPRRCGLASHIGVTTGLAALGCAKTWFVGNHRQPGPRRGDRAPLEDRGELLGHVVRTQDGIRPVYASPGHRIGFDQACALVVATASRYRLPDPIRRADHISRSALRR